MNEIQSDIMNLMFDNPEFKKVKELDEQKSPDLIKKYMQQIMSIISQSNEPNIRITDYIKNELIENLCSIKEFETLETFKYLKDYLNSKLKEIQENIVKEAKERAIKKNRFSTLIDNIDIIMKQKSAPDKTINDLINALIKEKDVLTFELLIQCVNGIINKFHQIIKGISENSKISIDKVTGDFNDKYKDNLTAFFDTIGNQINELEDKSYANESIHQLKNLSTFRNANVKRFFDSIFKNIDISKVRINKFNINTYFSNIKTFGLENVGSELLDAYIQQGLKIDISFDEKAYSTILTSINNISQYQNIHKFLKLLTYNLFIDNPQLTRNTIIISIEKLTEIKEKVPNDLFKYLIIKLNEQKKYLKYETLGKIFSSLKKEQIINEQFLEAIIGQLYINTEGRFNGIMSIIKNLNGLNDLQISKPFTEQLLEMINKSSISINKDEIILILNNTQQIEENANNLVHFAYQQINPTMKFNGQEIEILWNNLEKGLSKGNQEKILGKLFKITHQSNEYSTTQILNIIKNINKLEIVDINIDIDLLNNRLTQIQNEIINGTDIISIIALSTKCNNLENNIKIIENLINNCENLTQENLENIKTIFKSFLDNKTYEMTQRTLKINSIF